MPAEPWLGLVGDGAEVFHGDLVFVVFVEFAGLGGEVIREVFAGDFHAAGVAGAEAFDGHFPCGVVTTESEFHGLKWICGWEALVGGAGRVAARLINKRIEGYIGEKLA